MLTRLDELLGHGEAGRPALTYRSQTLSYAELRAQVAVAAAGLRRAGLRRGERVVLYLDKRVETVVAMLAVSAAGGVLVPVNPVFKPAQVGYVVTDCAARFLVTTSERCQAVLAEPAVAAVPEQLIVIGPGPAADSGPVAGRATSWEELCSGPAEPSQEPMIDTDLAAIF